MFSYCSSVSFTQVDSCARLNRANTTLKSSRSRRSITRVCRKHLRRPRSVSYSIIFDLSAQSFYSGRSRCPPRPRTRLLPLPIRLAQYPGTRSARRAARGLTRLPRLSTRRRPVRTEQEHQGTHAQSRRDAGGPDEEERLPHQHAVRARQRAEAA